MKTMRTPKTLARKLNGLALAFGGLTLAASLSLPALSAGPAPQASVAARQAGFKKMGTAMKALNEQLKSGAPDKVIVLKSAQTLAATAREQTRLFPAGSGPSPTVKTDALPAIWTDRAAFDALANRMVAESGKLVSLANAGNFDAVRAQVKATGAVCSSCHRQFRADN